MGEGEIGGLLRIGGIVGREREVEKGEMREGGRMGGGRGQIRGREIRGREETGTPALVLVSFMEESGFPRERLVWFDFCFMALQHILGHFERSQLP